MNELSPNISLKHSQFSLNECCPTEIYIPSVGELPLLCVASW